MAASVKLTFKVSDLIERLEAQKASMKKSEEAKKAKAEKDLETWRKTAPDEFAKWVKSFKPEGRYPSLPHRFAPPSLYSVDYTDQRQLDQIDVALSNLNLCEDDVIKLNADNDILSLIS